MVAGAKGYKNGLGAMSAEARMVVGEKGMLEAGIAWESMYAEFESYDGMPKIGTRLYNWQSCQLSNTHVSCLNAKILKEKKENIGSAIWSERRVKLKNQLSKGPGSLNAKIRKEHAENKGRTYGVNGE